MKAWKTHKPVPGLASSTSSTTEESHPRRSATTPVAGAPAARTPQFRAVDSDDESPRKVHRVAALKDLEQIMQDDLDMWNSELWISAVEEFLERKELTSEMIFAGRCKELKQMLEFGLYVAISEKEYNALCREHGI